MTKKINYFVLISIIALVIGFIATFFIKDIKTLFYVEIVFSLISILSSIIALVIIKMKNQKGKILSILVIIFSFIILFISVLIIFSINLLMDPEATDDSDICQNAVKCVDKDGVSKCKFKDFEQLEMKCKTSLLKENQMK